MLSVSLILTGIYVEKVTEVKAENSDNIRYSHFLKANGTVLKDNYGQGNQVLLKGVNAGGYMLQELWMCPTKETGSIKDQTDIINTLVSKHGKTKMRQLIAAYEKAYWTEKDFQNCKDLGMNCIRLPIWYRNLVDEYGNWYADAFERIDWFVEKAGEYGMYVIIDMHGAFGSQNGSDTSGVEGNRSYDKDSKGAMIAKKDATKFFFGDEANNNQEKYYQMWEKIAQHYKGNPVVAGYDLLNEPFGAYRNSIDSITELGLTEDAIHTTLWNVYDTAYRRIRAIDSDHVIIMEAVWEASDLPDPSTYNWENIMYEYHHYDYVHTTDTQEDAAAQITSMTSKLESIFEKNYNVPSYMGEFNFMATTTAWSEGLDLLNSYNISWTSWGYKCTKGMGNWGLYNNTKDDSNIADIFTENFESVSQKWSNVKTESYKENKELINVFKTKMNSSPITGLTDAVSSSIPKISEAKVTSDIGEIELTYKTPEGMPSDAKYYIYLDNETEPSNIISSRIEAENYSGSSEDIHDNIQDKDQNGIPNDNVGGTHNGEWTRYDNIDFGNGNATEVTVRYSKKWVSNDHQPKLEVYIDDVNDPSKKVGTINLVQSEAEAEKEWSYFKLGTAMLDTKITEKHNVYIKYVANDGNNVCNLDWIEFSSQQVQSGTIKYSDLDSGNHKITIKTYVNGNFSDATVIDNIQLSGILINESIGVEGFQIKTNDTSDKVAYRAVCKAPNIGSKFTLGGREYTVKDVGTIYTLDTDNSGIHANAKVGDAYTELSSTTVDDTEYKYVGRKKYNGSQRTYGYLATEKGVYKDWNAEDTQNSYYVRTMYDGETYSVISNTIHVRAFIVATYNNKEYIVYGKNVAHMSIAEVANYIYENSLSSNFTGHKYLYESILSKLDSENPYYKASTVAYGWNDNLYTPNAPSIINGSLNKYVKKDRITASATQATDTEGPEKLFDGDVETKYCTIKNIPNDPLRIQWEMQRPATITSYTLTTGNDTATCTPNRNPKAWKLFGSMDGTTWTELDDVNSGGMAAENYKSYTYGTDVQQAYQYFKLEISSSEGSTGMGQIQLSELSLQGYVSK